jgi:uncharacterized protein (TIGR00725 family)
VGELLGERGLALVSGGLGGVMEAASRGARERGALVIGILPQDDPDACNDWVDVSIATGLADARNVLIANTADVFIAIGGSFGTLSEIAFALKRRKKVIALSTWSLDTSRMQGEPFVLVDTPEAAVEAAAAELAG